ncbi:MAG: tRNA (adenosine(37)-N6)-dimethylallyltransferase MiaA [Nevskiales bacterium]|nr:tRNA (adenosine(37)-N6)-dimethylallyltransferase MiaA [Nevskiales bacterium]
MNERRRQDPGSARYLPVALLMGPTASGKSSLVLALAEHLPLEIISVDSAQIYRGMDIGTAKPSPAVRKRIPHHLIDILDPRIPYSVAQFRRDALRHIDAVRARQRIPLLVGGSMLYFRALQKGLRELPPADVGVRTRLQAEAEHSGWPALHARLAVLDPARAAQLHPNDAQRIQRALEIIELTGRRSDEQHPISENAGGLSGPVIKLGLMPADRGILHEQIRRRFLEMMEQGFLGEVANLRKRNDLHSDLPSMRAVGYRQLWQHLDGACDLDTAIARGIAATRQLAKRQLTWLRAEDGLRAFDPYRPDLPDRIRESIDGFDGHRVIESAPR